VHLDLILIIALNIFMARLAGAAHTSFASNKNNIVLHILDEVRKVVLRFRWNNHDPSTGNHNIRNIKLDIN
jgi:hypothetical protein